MAINPYFISRQIKDPETRDELRRFVDYFNGILAQISPTASGPVTSFNGRVGAVTPVLGDYNSFFLTPAEGDAAYQPLNSKLTTFAALANASGFLKNDGAGVLSYAQPDAGNLTGTTLKSTVVTSSLTSVGTLSSLTMGGAITGVTGLTMASGQVLAAAGSNTVAAVGLGATDTGWYSATTGQITATVSGNKRFTFHGSGFRFDHSGVYALLDANNNEFLKFASAASAVNEITIANAATGSPVTLSGTGGDSRVSLKLLSKAAPLLIESTAATAGVTTLLTITGAAHTGQTASTEVTDITVNLARTVQWATGALATQRAFIINAPTYAFVGASTITDAATLYISGAPAAGTNATITNKYALWVDAGDCRFDANVDAATFSVAGSAGADGSFTTVDGKTVTVTKGLITSIV